MNVHNGLPSRDRRESVPLPGFHTDSEATSTDSNLQPSSEPGRNAKWRALVSLQPVRRPLPHLFVYGSTNKYKPVIRSRAIGSSAMRPTQPVYFPSSTETPLTMTPTVNTMDSQRCVCRIHLFQFIGNFSEPA